MLLLGAVHHLVDEAVGVELPQRAVEVVGAADRPARLHARETSDRGAREQPELFGVHVHQRVEEHLRELLVRHRAHRARGFHRLAELVEVGAAFAAFAAVFVDARAEHREVDLEDGLEHLVVAGVLHERRAERSLERISVFERHVLDRAHRVEVLGHRNGQTRGAKLVHEALQHVEHVRLGGQDCHVSILGSELLRDQRVDAGRDALRIHIVTPPCRCGERPSACMTSAPPPTSSPRPVAAASGLRRA